MGKIANFCSIFSWLDALVIYASLAFFGSTAEINIAFLSNIYKKSSLMYFRALSSQLSCVLVTRRSFLLTFIHFFYACMELRKCYLKRNYDPNFLPSRDFSLFYKMSGLACSSIFKSLVLCRILMRCTLCSFLPI